MSETPIDAGDDPSRASNASGTPDTASNAPAGPDGASRPGSRPIGRPFAVAVGLATLIVLVAVAVVALTTPLYMHGGLERAGSAGFLGATLAEAQAISDATVRELFSGPGTFDFPWPDDPAGFYDASEASHLRDARAVLGGLLALAGLSLLVIGVALIRSRRAPRTWRAISNGAGLLVLIFVGIGLLFVLAFDAAFTLFHQLFFPGGNWSFDFATQRMVQLYPIPFWQEATTVMGAIVVVLGTLVWWAARRRTRTLAAANAGPAP